MAQEYIICSAIYFDDGQEHEHQPKNIKTGLIVCGRRHHNCYATLSSIGKTLKYDKTEIVRLGLELEQREVQGFLTSKDRFVNREEAWLIACEAKQIKESIIIYKDWRTIKNKKGASLFSEDLY